MSYQYNREDVYAFAHANGFETRQKGKELEFKKCPYCNGGGNGDEWTFSINLDSGAYCCLRASCGEQGHFVELCRDFDFPLAMDVPKIYKDMSRFGTHIQPKDEAVAYMASRCIGEEITKRYQLTVHKNNPDILVFPFFDEDNKLTMIFNWIDRTEAIDPALANPLCILAGIKATPKNGSWDGSEMIIANSGNVSYDVYLRASSLYSFAQKKENQQKYGLMPYASSETGWEGGTETGAHYASVYADFEDGFIIDNAIRQGWYKEDGNYKYYANSNIVSPNKVAKHVFKGANCTLTEGKNATDDIYVVDNYNESKSIYNANFLGRLIRFNNLTVTYRGVKNEKGITPYSALTSGSNTNIYPSWLCTSGILVDGSVQYVVSKPWYKLAYAINNICLYGSIALCYPEVLNTTHASTPGFYTARTSGYSRFAGKPVPENGATGSVLAIYAIYSHSYNFSETSRDQSAAFQLSTCRFQDFLPEYYNSLTEEDLAEREAWIDANTPEDSIALPQTLKDDDME